ncbi:MAG TPA: hypothetical protein VFQ38_13170 [Longimicrobiales bacterium]|nr:hypothetical protein [Longimicrobiales bacterium]
MKLVMIVYSGPDRRLVPALLDEHHAGGWTELSQAHGAGSTGRRDGSRAWPGDAAVYFSIVPAERADELSEALRDEAARRGAGERLHAAVLPIETFF